jgi:outer membrane immunogenic protein
MKFVGIAAACIGLLSLGQAQAADLAPRPYTKAPALAPVYNWTGFYLGGHVGYGWADTDHTMSVSFALGTLRTTSNRDGLLGGGQVGYNWQTGAMVLGVEADASWTDIKGTGVAIGGGGPFRFTTTNDWIATVTGRIGFAANNILFYGKGGAAFTELKYNNFFAGVPPTTVANFSDTRTGWTVGAGIEYGITPNWTAKIEYNYMDFGNRTYIVAFPPAGVGATTTHTIDDQLHLVKAGVNYRF